MYFETKFILARFRGVFDIYALKLIQPNVNIVDVNNSVKTSSLLKIMNLF